MEYLRQAAMATVGRACGFAALAIACIMVGLSFDLAQMLRAGAVLTLLLSLGLCTKAWIAERQDHRGTEVWLTVPRERRPPTEIAQRIMASVMREACFRFAYPCAGISAGFGFATIVIQALH